MIDDRPHRKRPRGRAPLPDTRALEIFVAVVDEGSFTAAARRLGMTQPGASRAVALLERDLGVRLLDRGLRPIRPTGAGRLVQRHGQRLLAEMDALRAGLRRATRERFPSLRLGLIVSVTAAIAPLAKALQTIADDVRIWTALTPELAQGLRRRELDVLVTSDPMEDMPGVERRRVLTEPFVLVLPSALAKTHAKLGLRELAKRLPFVRYTARSIIGRTIEAHLARNRVAAAQRLVELVGLRPCGGRGGDGMGDLDAAVHSAGARRAGRRRNSPVAGSGAGTRALHRRPRGRVRRLGQAGRRLDGRSARSRAPQRVRRRTFLDHAANRDRVARAWPTRRAALGV